MRHVFAVIALLLSLASISTGCEKLKTGKPRTSYSAESDDTDAWRKYARNDSNDTFVDGFAGDIEYAGKLNKKRLFDNYTLQRGGMVAADGRIFVPNDKGRMVAIKLDTGEIEWLSQPALASSKQFSSPTFHKGLLFCGTQPGGLVCMDSTDGRLQWEQTEPSAIKGVRTCPAILDDVVFFVDVESRVFQLDAFTGKLIDRIDLTRTESALSDPLVYGNSIMFGTPSGNFQALDRDFSTLWVDSTDSGIDCTPVLINDKVLFSGLDCRLYILDAKTGGILRIVQLEGRSNSTPLVHDGRAIVCDDENFVYCILTETGEIQWKVQVEGSPASLLIGFQDRIVVVSSMNAVFHRVDLAIPDTQTAFDEFYRKKSPFSVITVDEAREFAENRAASDGESGELKPRPVGYEELTSIFPKGIEALFARHARMYVLDWEGKVIDDSPLPEPAQSNPIYYRGSVYLLDTDGYINVFKCQGITKN